MPLPLSARKPSSFMRSHQSPNHHPSGAASADNNDVRRPEPYPSGYGFENRFPNFPNFGTNGQPQTALVNNYVYPATENASFSFNDSNVVADNDNDVESVENDDDTDDAPKNFATNDTEEDLDEKPTDYSLRFQESEEVEYMSGAPPPKPPSQQPQLQPPGPVAAKSIENDDDDDDLCVDAVKSYFVEATPFDTPGPISEATSVNDLTNITDEAPIRRHHNAQEDEEVSLSRSKD